MDYGYLFNKIPMYCDSKSAIAVSCNTVHHSKSKHIDLRYHFIKEHVEKGTGELYFVGTEYQLADLLTKALPPTMFADLVHQIGMRCLTPEDKTKKTKYKNIKPRKNQKYFFPFFLVLKKMQVLTSFQHLVVSKFVHHT
jgi:hypothetical protein